MWISTWDESGNRVDYEKEIKPHLYIEVPRLDNPDGKSMFRNSIEKV